MKDVKIKLLCFLFRHKWRYENKIVSVFPKRQCNRCGLVHELVDSKWVGWIRYKEQGFKGTEQERNTQQQKWKDEQGIIE